LALLSLERLHHGLYLIAVSRSFALCLTTMDVRFVLVRAPKPKVEHIISKLKRHHRLPLTFGPRRSAGSSSRVSDLIAHT
jgi:hypothetical protein